ncbi:MAG: hypothetical protein Q9188_001607 [Gyalolechia gomerana]
MRLIRTSTLQLHNFHDDSIPPYVGPSHTWGDEEVTLQDLEKPSSKSRAGYAKVTGCYVTWDPASSKDYEEFPFRQSRWFMGGWTLQELLAPEIVVFYDQNWVEIGTKMSLQNQISTVTRFHWDTKDPIKLTYTEHCDSTPQEYICSSTEQGHSLSYLVRSPFSYLRWPLHPAGF